MYIMRELLPLETSTAEVYIELLTTHNHLCRKAVRTCIHNRIIRLFSNNIMQNYAPVPVYMCSYIHACTDHDEQCNFQYMPWHPSKH